MTTGISVRPSKCFTFHVTNLEQLCSSATFSIVASIKFIFKLIFPNVLSNNCSTKASADSYAVDGNSIFVSYTSEQKRFCYAVSFIIPEELLNHKNIRIDDNHCLPLSSAMTLSALVPYRSFHSFPFLIFSQRASNSFAE